MVSRAKQGTSSRLRDRRRGRLRALRPGLRRAAPPALRARRDPAGRPARMILPGVRPSRRLAARACALRDGRHGDAAQRAAGRRRLALVPAADGLRRRQPVAVRPLRRLSRVAGARPRVRPAVDPVTPRRSVLDDRHIWTHRPSRPLHRDAFPRGGDRLGVGRRRARRLRPAGRDGAVGRRLGGDGLGVGRRAPGDRQELPGPVLQRPDGRRALRRQDGRRPGRSAGGRLDASASEGRLAA